VSSIKDQPPMVIGRLMGGFVGSLCSLKQVSRSLPKEKVEDSTLKFGNSDVMRQRYSTTFEQTIGLIERVDENILVLVESNYCKSFNFGCCDGIVLNGNRIEERMVGFIKGARHLLLESFPLILGHPLLVGDNHFFKPSFP
jgi:hypothetical protein